MGLAPLHVAGHIVNGRYRIVRALGRGAMGTTYEALRLDSGETVALKQLAVVAAGDWKAVELFEREARVLAALDHPAIPKYLEHFTADEGGAGPTLYIVRTLAQGRSLEEAVREGTRWDEPALRRIASELLLVCAYLHELHPPIVHRDIKPGNVIIDEDGHCSVVDFGSVREAISRDGGSTIAGTIGYMAPEQLHGAALPQSDLYGVAATLLFVITGKPPRDFGQHKLKIQFKSELTIRGPLVDWLEKMLEPIPEDRFSSARAAIDALQAPILSRPPPANAKRGLRDRLALIATACVVCVVLVGGIGFWAVVHRLRDKVMTSDESYPLRLHIAESVHPHMSPIHGLAVFPDGHSIVTGGDDFNVKISSLDDTTALPRILGAHDSKVRGVAVTRDGKTIASVGDSTLKLWDVDRGALLHSVVVATPYVYAVALSPDGKSVATAGSFGKAAVYSVETGQPIVPLAGDTVDLYAIAYSPDGKWIVTGAVTGAVTVFKSTGEKVRSLTRYERPINNISYSPDGGVISIACDDHHVYFAQPVEGSSFGKTEDLGDEAWHGIFSADGRYIATGGRNGIIYLYDMTTRRPVARAVTGQGPTVMMAFLPDGKSFVATNAAGTANVWRFGAATTEVPVAGPDAKEEPLPAPIAEGGDELGRAREATDNYKVAEAVRILLEVQRKHPSSAIVHAYLARAAYRSGQLRNGTCTPEAVAAAEAELVKADAIDPSLPDTKLARAWLRYFAGDPVHARDMALSIERSGMLPLRASIMIALLDVQLGDMGDAERRATALIRTVKSGSIADQSYQVLESVYSDREDKEAERALKAFLARRR